MECKHNLECLSDAVVGNGYFRTVSPPYFKCVLCTKVFTVSRLSDNILEEVTIG